MPAVTKTTRKALSPLRIEVQGAGQKYRTIGELVWDNVPPFAVLTGVNGSGKTQLLELLAFKLTGTQMPDHEATRNISITVSPDAFDSGSVAFVPSAWDMQGAPSLGIQQLTQVKAQLYQQLASQHQIATNRHQRAKRSKVDKVLGRSLDTFSQQDFIKVFPDNYAFMLEEEDVMTGLAHVMLAHKVRLADALMEGMSYPQAEEKVGTAPWDIVNEALGEAGFAYRVISPREYKFEDVYVLRLRSTDAKVELMPGELSSGEKAIFRTLLWLFNSRHNDQFPKLLLLDEPDSHLHPSMTRPFLTVVKDVLVDRYGVRVIMATHSPSTVALAPEGSVFEMYKEDPRIRPATSTAHAVGLLTSGLVVVSRATKFVFVEDEDDVPFYRTVCDLLIELRALEAEPSLVFLPASIGSGAAKVAGGESKVRQWIEKFDQLPLIQMFKGVRDLDEGNAATARVRTLGRYSFENYLLDPIIVFGLLVDQGTAPPVPDVSISQGEEHRIGALTAPRLQSVVDAVVAVIEPKLTGLKPADRARVQVSLANGIRLSYPQWALGRQGHRLLVDYQNAFGGPRAINTLVLLKMMRRIRLLPDELVDLMRELQGP
jgi:predicted ATPase